MAWRPYCYGHWVWTDCGWFWESDEPWSWACYHYGYWLYDPVYAWIWVPGIEWGPAWVSWRGGGGYIGWAPLAPPHGAGAVAAAPYVFVEVNRFNQPVRPSTAIVNNTTIINNTTVINNIKRESRTLASAEPRRVVVNEGPGVAVVENATGKKFKAVAIQEAARTAPVPAALSHESRESQGKEKRAKAAAERPVTPSERKVSPDEKAESTSRPGSSSSRIHPEKPASQTDSKDHAVRPGAAPEGTPPAGGNRESITPPRPAAPPAQPPRAREEKREDKDHTRKENGHGEKEP